MKIVHLNTHSHGGAAVVARRLHRAALAAGLSSVLITRFGSADAAAQPGQRALRRARLQEMVRAGATHPQLYALGKLVERRIAHRNLANRPAGYEVFSPINTSDRFQDCVDRDDPTIIHLHWIAGFVDHAAFFRRNAHRRFVWTLHDMNPLTGGCHHADGCEGFMRGCGSCPQLEGTIDPDYAARVLRNKADALAPLRDDQLVIASPSGWLLELSRRSPVTARFQQVRIPNPSLDARPAASPTSFRLQHGIPRDKKIVLFVSENLRNPRKGVSVLFEALRLMARTSEVHLLGIGRRSEAPADLPATYVGRVTDEHALAGYISASDVLVNPSVMENSPLTIIEALTCGTPAVAFDVGGVAELIGDQGGVIVAERTAPALASAIERVLFGGSVNRETVRQRAVDHAPATVLQQYRSVYNQLAAS